MMTIDLPASLERAVLDAVQSGRFASVETPGRCRGVLLLESSVPELTDQAKREANNGMGRSAAIREYADGAPCGR